MMETSSTAESLLRRFPLVKLTQAQAEEKRIYLILPCVVFGTSTESGFILNFGGLLWPLTPER